MLYAPSAAVIVLVGATGTGKTQLAQHIHRLSGATGSFVDRTAAEIVETLAADQLFGHERGAFTGAVTRTTGAFGEASGGTLLLDDFHLAPTSTQSLLLRALGRGYFRPLAAQRDVGIGCRLIIGLGDCPDALMRSGLMLPDLRFRLGYCMIRLAPLAERRDEIVPLAKLFLSQCPAELRVSGPTRLSEEIIPVLEAASWPGNVRELKECIRAAYLHAQHRDRISLADLPAGVDAAPHFEPRGDRDSNARAIEWALHRCRNHVGRAAKLIGAHRNTVAAYRSLKPLHNSQSPTVQSSKPARAIHRDRGEATEQATAS